MGRVVRAVLVLALAAPLLLATASPCLACSCTGGSARAILRDEDAVAFVGEVVGNRAAAGGTVQVVRVDGVHQGELPAELELFAPLGPTVANPCAVLLPTGGRIAVIAWPNPDGTYSTNACALTSPAELRRARGAAAPPVAGRPTVSPSGPATADGGGELPPWAVALLGLVLATVLIGGRLAYETRRARRDPGSGGLAGSAEVPGPDVPAG